MTSWRYAPLVESPTERSNRLTSVGFPRGSEPHPKRFRARLNLLTARTLLLGALCLLAPALTEALTIANKDSSSFITASDTPLLHKDSDTVWSATLMPVTVSGGVGCGSKSECDAQLTNNSFTVGDQQYHFSHIADRTNGSLFVKLTAKSSSALHALVLSVDSTEFDWDKTFLITDFVWTDADLAWTVGTPVSLSIGPSRELQSTDATLSDLAASSSTSATGTFTALNFGTFDSGTTSYTASVANSVSHVKLTPTANDDDATVKVGKGSSLTTVPSGSASGAIMLSVGSNILTIEVTAEDGATTQTYTVTVTREQAPPKPTPTPTRTPTPAVSLSVEPRLVTEGSPVTVTVRLSSTLSSSVTIPLTLSHLSAEDGDYGSLSSITISAGSTTGTGTVATNQDADTDDETFMIALGELPSTVAPGSPDSVMVKIQDDDESDATFADPDGDPDGSGDVPNDSADDSPANRAPVPMEEIRAATLDMGESRELDLSDAFADPDGDLLEYRAESSNDSVAAAEVDGDKLTVHGIWRGNTKITVTATDPEGKMCVQVFAVTLSWPEALWYLPPASDMSRQGFVRVVNHSDTNGNATITATDDEGRTYEPLTLALEPREAVHFTTDDLENGNPAKGLTGATGPGIGGWRLAINSVTLDVEALAYIRTADGFVAGMNKAAPLEDGAVTLPFFNPASDIDHMSLLRLVNPTTKVAEVIVTGTDDMGHAAGAQVRLTLPAGNACTVSAAQLESGSGLACGEPQIGFGDGNGRWRLTVTSNAQLVTMNLLSSSTGHLTNLTSKAASNPEGIWHVDLFPSASNPQGRQGIVRVTNHSTIDGVVRIAASDDTDTPYEPLHLRLDAGKTAHVHSDDLELGNQDKGLMGRTGSGIGNWGLALSSEEINFEANAYARTADGFLTAMSATVPRKGSVQRVAFLKPASATNPIGMLRLVNRSTQEATVFIDGTDDLGLRPGSAMQVSVPAASAVELTAAQLESGEADAIESGALGDGTGHWRLRVNGAVTVLSLVSSETGLLANLSGADKTRKLGPLPLALLPASTAVALEHVRDRQLAARWSAVEGALYDVDVLQDGVREEIRSLKGTRSTSIRWWYRSPAGTYTIRVRSVNADGVRGPWSAHSNEIVFD